MGKRNLGRLAVRSLAAVVLGLALGACVLFAQREWGAGPGLTQDPLPSTRAPTPPGDANPVRWLKGQLHAHSNRSGDSVAPPEDALRWYAQHGYDFVVFTDHNHVTRIPSTAPTLAIPGVELTQNYRSCTPSPGPGMQCNFHVNAWFVSATEHLPSFPASIPGNDRFRAYATAVQMAQGLGALVQLNHPNFHWALDAQTIAALAHGGAGFLEIANESSDSANEGDAAHPSTEALWDAALSSGAHLYATATDDAHRYAGGDEGDRGFVIVRSRKDPMAIREALERGDFYASTGVLLSQMEERDGQLEIELAAPSAPHPRIDFIGRGGQVLTSTEGPRARFELRRAAGGYVRAVARDGLGHTAWTQPLFIP